MEERTAIRKPEKRREGEQEAGGVGTKCKKKRRKEKIISTRGGRKKGREEVKREGTQGNGEKGLNP